MSSVTDTAGAPVGRTTGRVVAATVLAVIAILLIIAAIIYFIEPAHSLPSILGTIKDNGHNASRANASRPLRGVVSLIVGVICLVGAWFAYAWKVRERA